MYSKFLEVVHSPVEPSYVASAPMSLGHSQLAHWRRVRGEQKGWFSGHDWANVACRASAAMSCSRSKGLPDGRCHHARFSRSLLLLAKPLQTCLCFSRILECVLRPAARAGPSCALGAGVRLPDLPCLPGKAGQLWSGAYQQSRGRLKKSCVVRHVRCPFVHRLL